MPSSLRLPQKNPLSRLATHWRVVLLVCVTTLIWLAQYDRWTAASWTLPTDYRGDSLEILARIKAASEGDTVPLRPQMISRLGAPYGANWSAYPSSDLLLLWSLGQVARVIGVFRTANLALLLAAVTAALSFYGCARWLRARWEWAFAGALLFAFTFQTFHRGLAHLFIVYSWTVPLALLSSAMIATSRRLQLRGPSGLFCLATAAAIGVGNPYTLFLYLQLVGWALIGQWLGDRRRENIMTGVIALGIAVAAVLLVESHVWLYQTDTAATSPIVRNYGGTERYALKPIELLLPPASHRWSVFAFFGQRYVRWSDWRTGEAFAPYLGAIGIVGFAWLAFVSLRALLRRDRLPGVALPATWILAFASVGGITNMLAFFTSVMVFRATNRFSIFISAIVLLFLVIQMSRWARSRAAWISVSLAAAVAVFGLLDQLPRPMEDARRERIAQRVASDRDLGRRLEQAVPRGSMMFQLPVVGFPEVVPPHQLSDYEYFRPYLGTDSLRITYGSLKGRSRGRWQRDIAQLPTPLMVKELEKYGFAAVYLNRRGFADRGEKLLSELAAAGYTRLLNSQLGEQVVVLLNPKPNPVKPLARTLTFGRGWHEQQPGEPRWAFAPATMLYFNPNDAPVHAVLKVVLSAPGTRHVNLAVEGGEPLPVEVNETPRTVLLRVVLRPGSTRIDLQSDERPVRLGFGRDQLRAFAIHETRVEVESGVDPAAVVGGT